MNTGFHSKKRLACKKDNKIKTMKSALRSFVISLLCDNQLCVHIVPTLGGERTHFVSQYIESVELIMCVAC